MVVLMNWPHTHRCSRVEEVACLEGEELTDEAHQFVHRAEHVGRVTLLHRLPVDIEVKVQVLDVLSPRQRSRQSPCRVPRDDPWRSAAAGGRGR